MMTPWAPSLPTLAPNWRAVLEGEPRAVVFFWAVWSPPDQRLARELERVAPEFNSALAYYAADVDEEWVGEAMLSAQVFTTPSLALFCFGQTKGTSVGVLLDEELRLKLESWSRL